MKKSQVQSGRAPRSLRATHRAAFCSLVVGVVSVGLALGVSACSGASGDPGGSSEDALLRASDAKAQEEMSANQAIAERLLAQRPGGQARIDRLRRATAALSGTTRTVVSVNPTITVGNGQDVVVTQSPRFAYDDLARSLTNAPSKANQLAIYETLYAALPAAYRSDPGVAPPKLVAAETADQIAARNHAIVADAARITALLPPRLAPVTLEPSLPMRPMGAAAPPTVGDGAATCDRDANGLFDVTPSAQRLSTTHIKKQGHRGTCVAFAITAAVETAYVEKHGGFLNLSEQGLYGVAKAIWTGDDYGDGLSTKHTLDDMTDVSYRFLNETAWTYNPSWSRISNDATERYTDSCVDYDGRHCSNTTHQGTRVTAGWDVGAPTDSGISVASQSDFEPDDFGVALAKMVVALTRSPVVLSIEVTPSFRQPWNGHLIYRGDGEETDGNHAVLIVGFADNAQLPATSPPGAGGGYFIVKNSWGCGFGDGGFIYVPYRWITDYANSMSAVHVS